MRDRRHLVAGADAERAQRDLQRIGAVGDADAVADADELRELLLEVLHLRSENVPAARQHLGDGGIDLGLVREISGLGIGLGDHQRYLSRFVR